MTNIQGYSPKRRGFTLTEAAIFLGLAGIVLAAIWAAASAVNTKAKVRETLANMQLVVQQMRTLYGTKGSFTTWGTGTDITADMINAEVIPTAMIDPANGAQMRSVWGTRIQLLVGSDQRRFDIKYADSLPTEICIMIAALGIGAERDKGLLKINVGGADYTGKNLNDLNTTTIPSCTNVTFTYNLSGAEPL